MEIRPLRPEDRDAARGPADAVWPPEASRDPDEPRRYWAIRYERVLGTDPGGCWAAVDDDGRIVGTAIAHVRDGVWGLAHLAVMPDVQEHGIGHRLLDATLAYAEGSRAGLIASSTDPKAMRLYARAGFDLRPCVAAAGIVDRSAIPAGLRSTDAGVEALELGGPLGRAVRGAAYDPEDLAVYVASGGGVVRCGDRGIAVHRDEGVALVLAGDEETATDLLWSCLARSGNGTTVEVDYVMAGQDWAVRTVLAARLDLSPGGPFFIRGSLDAPLRPWIPTGGFL
ncbi:MAG TPA: GNAT family N-acetyltransferase [Solirubrobacteraceae bacterium]|jgi:GNAT superfamily N-acetyltransferase